MQTSSTGEVLGQDFAQTTQDHAETKTFIEEFGSTVIVDKLTYMECIIAHKRGVAFRCIKDINKVSHKIFLEDQDYEQ